MSRSAAGRVNYLDTSQKYTCGVYVPYNEPKSNARLYYTQYWEREPLAPGTLACRLGVQFESDLSPDPSQERAEVRKRFLDL